MPTRLLASLLLLLAAAAQAQSAADDTVVQAREALRKKDRTALAAARMAVNAARHPLAMWVEYWELGNRLQEAQQAELDAFYARWPGTYVEDRLRNDWLLELGRRRDFANIRVEYPRFRMADDREAQCYWLVTQHLDSVDVRATAKAAWHAQRDLDDGCALLAKTLYDARLLNADDAWQEARLSMEANRPRALRAAAALVAPAYGALAADLYDNPIKFLTRPQLLPAGGDRNEFELLAVMRAAANDPEFAAAQLETNWSHRLPAALRATAWAHVARQAALKQLPLAADAARRAWKLWDGQARHGAHPPWSDELLAWHARAALRDSGPEKPRWALLLRAIDALPAAEQRDSAWLYWKARALQAQGGPNEERHRAVAKSLLESIPPQAGFYAKLAADELGSPAAMPEAPAPLTAAERDAPRALPGFQRALTLIGLGLRNEGVREWNFTLRGMGDRELLAAAQLACEREVWDRCINTSERTKSEIDVAQRFPLPWREQISARARDAGLDPALLFGLIRQESRFVADARSSVGASGLMQLMPATARWTAAKIGQPFGTEMINDRDINLKLGAAYLKRVLDDFGGSLAMAAAAYNAGPGRPRKWREGTSGLEPAAWAETIPFNETRDYVKKVLSNTIDYASLLGAKSPALKARLGPPVDARVPLAPAADKDLP